jgi:acetolactate synthase-1/2/3 large subunit
MGYGLPAALAAKAAHPGRDVVCFAGDGCFLMTGQELATAVRHRLNVVVLVFDNASYGTIRMHQERHYPGNAFGSDLANPDFAAYAEAFGALGIRVQRTDEFAPAFDRALSAGRPALLHLLTDPDVITTRMTVAEIRAAGAARGVSSD